MQNYLILCADCLRYDIFAKVLGTSALASEVAQADGLVFSSAFAPSPWTYPSSHSILTGLYPHNHGGKQRALYKNSVREPWPMPANPNLRTMFSDLKGRDYFTLGISTIFWALNEGCLYRGCDRIIRSQGQDLEYRNVPAKWVVDTFTDILDAEIKDNPFVAYLHFCDLHRSLDLETAQAYLKEPLKILPGVDGWDARAYFDNPEKTRLFRSSRLKLYEAVTRYYVAQILRLFDLLRQRGLLDKTTLVLTADHGEEFWDHEDVERLHYDCGYRSKNAWLVGTGHGHTLFNELVHVPLVFMNPGFNLTEQQVSLPVSLVDIYPTILDLTGVPPPDALDGRSLRRPEEDRYVLFESTLYGYERKGAVRGSVKHVYSPQENHFVRYDLTSDPREHEPAPAATDIRVKHMLDRLYHIDEAPAEAGIHAVSTSA